MSEQRKFTRRGFIAVTAAGAVGTAILAACQPPQTVEKIVEKPVEVTKVVEKAVEQTRVVEKPVETTKVVEKQVVVTAAPAAKGSVSIYWLSDWYASGDRGKYMDLLLELWRKNNPTRAIIPNAGDGSANFDKLIAADTVPDLIMGLNATSKLVYAKASLWQDITSNLKARNFDDTDLVKHEAFYMMDGKYYGLPMQMTLFTTAANKTLIENAGAKVPNSATWTWDDIVEVGQKVTQPDKNLWGASFEKAADHQWWTTALFANGGHLISEDGKKSLLLEGPALDTWTMFYDWMYKWKMNPTTAQVRAGKPSWGKGSYAFIYDPPIRGLEKFEGVQLLPPIAKSTGKRFCQYTAEANGVTTWTKKRNNLEETVDLAVFVVSKEGQQLKYQADTGNPPLRLSVWDNDAFGPKALRDVVKESTKYMISLEQERSMYFNAWFDAIVPALQEAVDNKTSVKEALAKACQVGDKVLAGVQV